jgi:hypothetical protein
VEPIGYFLQSGHGTNPIPNSNNPISLILNTWQRGIEFQMCNSNLDPGGEYEILSRFFEDQTLSSQGHSTVSASKPFKALSEWVQHIFLVIPSNFHGYVQKESHYLIAAWVSSVCSCIWKVNTEWNARTSCNRVWELSRRASWAGKLPYIASVSKWFARTPFSLHFLIVFCPNVKMRFSCHQPITVFEASLSIQSISLSIYTNDVELCSYTRNIHSWFR